MLPFVKLTESFVQFAISGSADMFLIENTIYLVNIAV